MEEASIVVKEVWCGRIGVAGSLGFSRGRTEGEKFFVTGERTASLALSGHQTLTTSELNPQASVRTYHGLHGDLSKAVPVFTSADLIGSSHQYPPLHLWFAGIY